MTLPVPCVTLRRPSSAPPRRGASNARTCRPAGLGGARRAAGCDPRLRRQLRLGLGRTERARLPRRGARDDARALSARVSSGRREPARRRSRRRRRSARGLGLGAVRDLLPGHAGRVPRRHPRRLPDRRARAAGGVRRVRDPALPDVHHRDLHRVQVGFDPPAACGLSLVLVLLGLLVLSGGGFAPGRTRARTARAARRRGVPPASRSAAAPPARFTALLALWARARSADRHARLLAVRGSSSTLPAAGIASAALAHRALQRAAAAAVATALALPVALLAVRQRRTTTVLLERSTYIVQALPGRRDRARARVLRGALRALPLPDPGAADRGLRDPVLPARARRGEGVGRARADRARRRGPVARAQRRSRCSGGSRCRWSRPGLAAAFCLVFLSAVTELTATLILVPIGVQTLSTQFWAYTTNLSYGAAAPYAALLVAIAAIPTYVLGRWFERLPSRAVVVTTLSIAGVGKSFGPNTVLHEVDLEVPTDRSPRSSGRREAARPRCCGSSPASSARSRARSRIGESPLKTAIARAARAPADRLRAAGRRALPAPHRARERRLRAPPSRAARRRGAAPRGDGRP